MFSFVTIPVTNALSGLSLLALPASSQGPLGNSSFLAGMQLIRYSNSAPEIVSPPQNFSVLSGSTIGFSQAAVGLAPLHYQWLLNGVPITNSQTSSLIISNVKNNDSGDYSFVVSNAFGSAFGVAGHVIVDAPPKNALINIDFAALPGAKNGLSAIGLGKQDYWNAYFFPSATTAVIPNLVLSDGTVSSAALIVIGAPGQSSNSATDPMYNTYIYSSTGPISVTLSNLMVGTYDLCIYGHGPATGSPDVSAANGVYSVSLGSVNYGTNSNISGAGWDSVIWQEGVQFVVFRSLQITNTSEPLMITVLPGNSEYALISGLQLLQVLPRSPSSVSLTMSKDSVAPLGSFVLSWPRTTPTFTLQVTGDLSNGQWNDVDPALVYQTPSDTRVGISVTAATGKQFYRLVAP